MIKYYTVWQQAIAHFLQACPTVRYYFNTQVSAYQNTELPTTR